MSSKIHYYIQLFESLENLYPPKGTPKAVPKTREGPLDSLSILYVIEEAKLCLQKYTTISDFLKVSKTFIVRMGGWVVGGKKGPSIFLKFKYINKQDVLIPNLASKVVYGY